ncbi:phage tail tape measure protein [uncultured Gemmiger sp.]|uniref:phage tail tape measure protein n=1 Tax=uncultured Gemmiger sp. TaxID=1623490 RepID=UPI00266EFDFF|nr:phage tail tape measure protein [uncultured Gemmiger sp.]
MAKTTELELAIRIAGKVDPSLQAAISQAQKQVSTLSTTLGTIGRVGLVVMGVGLAATVKGIADCTTEAEKFESQMAPVIRYVDGLADSMGNVSDAMAENGKTFKQNRDELARYIQDLSTEIPRDTENLTTISAALGQSGKGVDEQLNTSLLRDAAVAATAMDLDDQTAGEYMAKWEQAFTKTDANGQAVTDENGNAVHYDHDDVMRLMNQINYLGANNATTAAAIANSVNQSASIGQMAGVAPEVTAAIVTAMQASGVSDERVGTTVSRIYTNISKGSSATKKQKEAWAALGFDAEDVAASMQEDGTGTLRQVFAAINALPKDKKVATLNTLFNQWAIEGGAKITSNLDLLDKTLGEVQDPEKYMGSMEREFIINASTSKSIGARMANAKTALMQDIGDEFLPVKKQFSLLAIDVMNGIRHNLPQLQTLASTLADVATKGVTVLGDALQSAMPYIQQGLDYLNQNGEKVAKILAGVAGAFAAMSIAPQAEMAARGVGGVVKGGAGLLGSAINVVAGNQTGNGKQSIGSALLGRITGGVANAGSAVTNAQNFVTTTGNTSGAGAGTLWALLKNKIAGGNNAELLQQAAMTPGLLNYMPTMRQSIAQNPIVQKVTGTVGAVAGGVGNYLGGVGTSAKGFAKSQWNLAGGMANGAVAGISGIGQFINAAVGLPGAPANPGQGTGAALAAAGKQMLGGAGGMITNGAAGLVQAVAPFASAFGGIASAALPVVAVIGSIVAAVSILGDHLDDIRGIIGNVFGENGVAVFDGFLNTITTVKDRIVGIFSPENLASVRTAIVGMFGENAGTGFDNIVSIGQSVIGVFQQIVNFGTQTVKPMFEQVFGWVSTTLLPGLLNAFNAIAPQIGPLVTNIGTAVMNVAMLIGNAIQTILPVIENIVMVLVNVVATVAPPIIAAVSQIFANISNVVTSLQGVFDGLIQFITGVFTGNWTQAWEGVKQIFGNAFDALVELCKIPINAVIGVINGAVKGINSILGKVTTIPDWVPVVGGQSFSMQLPTIPMLAKGGFTDGVSIAGEAGTEAVISFDPSVRSANIANWQKAGQMLGVDPVQAASVAGAGSLTTDRVEVADIGGGSPTHGGTTAVGGGSFTFAPNITIQGNADYNVMMNAMTDAKEQFEQWFNEMMRKQQRTAYAR